MFSYKLLKSKHLYKLASRIFSTNDKQKDTYSKLSGDFIKSMKLQFDSHQQAKLAESKFGGIHIVTLMVESSKEAIKCAEYIQSVLDALRAPITIEYIEMKYDSEAMGEDIVAVQRNRAAIKISLKHNADAKREQYALNKSLDVFASVIHLNSFPGFNCRHPDLNMMLIIQNVSDDFTLLEYEPIKGVVETLRHSVVEQIHQYICFVFETVRLENRKKITFAHKVEELPLIDGHFINIAKNISERYEDIEVEFRSVNNVVRNVLWNPSIFDVICSSERYGTFLATICSAVAGGPSLFSAMEQGNNHAVFKPLHTKLSLTEYETVSAYATLQCVLDLTRYLCLEKQSRKLWTEICGVIEDGMRTKEFGGCCTDENIICHVVDKLENYTDFPKDLPDLE